MGLFRKNHVPDIYNRVKVVLDDLDNNIEMIDGNSGFIGRTVLSFTGFLVYYIAGVTKAKYATQVTKLFCDEYFNSSERKDAEEFLQECYSRAKRIADLLMQDGSNLGEILDAHSESLCALNEWEISDNNKMLIMSILSDFYMFLSNLK